MKKLLLLAVLFSANAFGQVYSKYPEPMYKSTANRITSLFFNETTDIFDVKSFNADQVTFTLDSEGIVANGKITFEEKGFTTKFESGYILKDKKRVELDVFQLDKLEKVISENMTTFLFTF